MTPEEFKAERQRLGLTQAQLAKLIGLYPLTISKYERGDRAIPNPTAMLMRLLKPPVRKG
jgi:transcriptional regulator with XRE-family HTH domain